MTIPNDELQRIASGLTKAQRAALEREVAYSMKVADRLMSDCLIRRFTHVHGSREYWLGAYTETGLAIRAIIEADRTLDGVGDE